MVFTDWGQYKRADIFQHTNSNTSTWMEMLEFWFQFHRCGILRIQFTISHHCLGNDLPHNRWQVITWTKFHDAMTWTGLTTKQKATELHISFALTHWYLRITVLADLALTWCHLVAKLNTAIGDIFLDFLHLVIERRSHQECRQLNLIQRCCHLVSLR